MQNVGSVHRLGGRGAVTIGSAEDWIWYVWPPEGSRAFRTEDYEDTSIFLLP